jgi:hypothetical protein
MEGVMNIKTSSDIPEYKIFEAFVRHSTYKDALTELEQYDATHKDSKIFNKLTKKKSLKYSFLMFRSIIDNGKLPSNPKEYTTEEVFAKLRSELRDRMFPFLSHRPELDTFGIGKAKVDIGMALLEYANFIDRGGKKDISEYKRQQERSLPKHEQPRVSKHGSIGHGGFGGGSVFDTSSKNHKSVRERIYDKMQATR